MSAAERRGGAVDAEGNGRRDGAGDDGARRRRVRIAAVGDFHYDDEHEGGVREILDSVRLKADVLVLCGDLTTHGRPEQMRPVAEMLGALALPVVTVLGNHDVESGAVEECSAILRERGVHVLDGTSVEIEGIGFAGVKGFGGGFGRGSLGPFGEPETKAFVQAAIDEALKLENALRLLRTETRVAVLHYSPIAETLVGEPEIIFPYLGSSRLLAPIETYQASVVFHGHAHTGVAEARTPTGIPVYNVALPVLRAGGCAFRVWSAEAPDRRGTRQTPTAALETVTDARS